MRRIFLLILPMLFVAMAAFSAPLALAQQSGENQATGQSYLDQAGKAGFGYDSGSASTPGAVLARVINVFLGFVGTIAFVVFLYGGFLWLTARGNEDQVSESKKYLFNATIGAGVVILAYAATYYITNILYQAASNVK